MRARSTCLFLPLLALACAAPPAGPLQTSAPPAKTPRVLFIGIDGCRPDALQVADAPFLTALANTGAASYTAQTCAITVSGPSWSSMLTGVWPDKHGVVDNGFEGQRIPSHPPVFAHVEEADRERLTLCVAHWTPIHTWHGKYAEASWAVDSDPAVTEAAVELLGAGDPDLLFLHYDGADHAGHSYGYGPAVMEYLEAIKAVDLEVGRVLTALWRRPAYETESWLVLVSTDHGGSGTGHGQDSPEHRTIFIIANGEAFPAGSKLLGGEVVDLAPTALRHLGLEPITPMDGRPLQGMTPAQP